MAWICDNCKESVESTGENYFGTLVCEACHEALIEARIESARAVLDAQKIGVKKIPDGTHKRAGRFDNGSRWYPNNEYYHVDGAFEVRSPSRAFPYSYLKHFYTLKFAKLLYEKRPDLYCDLFGIAYQIPPVRQGA